MGPLREKHRTAGSDNGGRYAAHSRDESEVELASVTVEIAGGPSQKLTPGVLDWHAEEALSTGQCVAFAVAVAERLALNPNFRHTYACLVPALCPPWNGPPPLPQRLH
jgi:hypothetical protein